MPRFELNKIMPVGQFSLGLRRAIHVAAICGGVSATDGKADAPPPTPGVVVPAIQIDGSVAGSPIWVKQIVVIGNTIFDSVELESLVAPFQNQRLGPDQIEELRLRLTHHLIEAGYINSGALIPPQTIVDGVLYVKIVEGHVSAVKITGTHHYLERYLTNLILPDPGAPLNISQLQERMQLLLQDGLLQQINAELKPGDAPGESNLDASVHEGPRFKLSLAAADDRPPSVGETGGMAGLSGRNLLGIGDATTLNFGFTHGYTDYAFDENIPVFSPAVSIFFRADKNHGSIVENSLKDLGILSRETSAEAGVSAQLVHDRSHLLEQNISVYYNDSRTYLLGMPFSFSGDDDGHSKVSAARYALDWTYRGTRQVFAARGTANIGLGELGVFGATLHRDSDLPDSNFVVWNGQAQYLHQLFTEDEIVARASLQLASRDLLPSEKVAIGGIDTVRGYAANTLVRDQGGFASAEYRHTVYHLRVPGVSHDAHDGGLALAAFYDAGAAGDKGESSRTWISGVGGGVRWSPAANCSLVFYKGFALHRLPDQETSLQEQGLHFRFNYDLPF